MLKGKKNLSRFLLFVGLLLYMTGIKNSDIFGVISGLIGAILISWVMIDYMGNKK